MHLIKLSVGSDSVDTLIAWQKRPDRARVNGHLFHLTRMWPKRADEILQGGSIYWVIAGLIQARQQVIGFKEIIGDDGIRRCAICLDETVHRVAPTPKRPFQGWRYLNPADAPADLTQHDSDDTLPPDLNAALAEIGVL